MLLTNFEIFDNLGHVKPLPGAPTLTRPRPTFKVGASTFCKKGKCQVVDLKKGKVALYFVVLKVVMCFAEVSIWYCVM